MTRFHRSSRQRIFIEKRQIIENLLVGDHPITVGKHEERSVVHPGDKVVSHGIVNGWRKLDLETDGGSLSNVLVHKVKSSYWEEQRHSNTVHQSYKNDHQNVRLFEMNNVLGT